MTAPFPPPSLMSRVSGLTSNDQFAQHGSEFMTALEQASPIPLFSYGDILDFGVGCGRLARLFADFRGRYVGVDVDQELVRWCGDALPWVEPVVSAPRLPIPLPDAQFDCIISISVFTHLNEADTHFYLSELQRLAKPGCYLFLTVHGHRAIDRARAERMIFDMLVIPEGSVAVTETAMRETGFKFIIQPQGHLTSENYEYGITFVGRKFIETAWSKYFDVIAIHSGAIHDFQDIVVLRRR